MSENLKKSTCPAYVNVGKRIIRIERLLMKSEIREFIKGRWFSASLATVLLGALMVIGLVYFLLVWFSISITLALGLTSILGSLPYEVVIAIVWIALPALLAIQPLIVSQEGYFLRLSRDENPRLDEAVSSLRGRYFTYLGMALLRSVIVGFFSLLLIFPGIIQAIAYSFAPYHFRKSQNRSRTRS